MAFEQLGQAVPVEERELGWDDTIEKESAGFIILPEGDYEFKSFNVPVMKAAKSYRHVIKL